MVYPPVWWDTNAYGWYWTKDGNGLNNHIGCDTLDIPDGTDFADHNHNMKPDCMLYWFSNKIKNPGHATLPDYMSQPEVECIGQAGHHEDSDKKFPWNAPGTAPVFGSCGTLGGLPNGCNNDGVGEVGDCCTSHCDATPGGKNAEEYDWPSIPTTVWPIGSNQEVAWYVSANHAGGYSYRLCKVPNDPNEECFQKTPLDFVGDIQWINTGADRKTGHRVEIKALQTTEGTSPPGSMWRANPLLPHQEEGGSDDLGHGHIVDIVKVPEDIEPGEYVLGFRWDCKCSPQVWNSCAQIIII